MEFENIIGENLKRMRSNEEGGMVHCLMAESVGGNAGHYEGIPCGGANFRYDGGSGLILYFGNSQDVPKEILPVSVEGIFRVPVDLTRCLPVGVSEAYLKGNPSENAENAIRETAIRYNRESGGRVKNLEFLRY